MILDILENADRYAALNGGFARAFDFLRRPDLNDLPAGRYEIDGERVFAVVAEEQGRAKEEANLETHREYIDIQLVLDGTDEMGWRPASSCVQPSTDYDPERDIRFFADGPEAWITVCSGAFAVFFPEDAHLPLISAGRIRKVVVKVAVDQG